MKIKIGPHTTERGQTRRALGFEIWAEDAVVWLFHRASGEVSVLTIKTAEERRDAFGGEADEWDKSCDSGNTDDKAYARERRKALNELVECLSETIADARNQGDPDDEQVRQQKLMKFMREKCAGKGGRSPGDAPFREPPSRLVFPTTYTGKPFGG